MSLRSIGTQVLGVAIILAAIAIDANAQASTNAQASSATYVAAEMTKGKLNPAKSKPGDEVALRLKDDVRSNGRVVLKKGTTITGVVKSVRQAEARSATKGQAQAMMEIEWLEPSAQGNVAHQLSIALRSVTQVNPVYAHEQNDTFAEQFALATSGSSTGTLAVPARSAGGAGGGGLFGGALGSTTGVAAGAVSGVGSTVGTVASTSTRTTQSNAALLNMPSVIAADHQTSSAIDGWLGTSASGQLFKTGRGELVSTGGSKQSVELFSHLNNDTVITSQNRNFEISSGAQMQLLVGVNRR
jgi:hypothetical protein